MFPLLCSWYLPALQAVNAAQDSFLSQLSAARVFFVAGFVLFYYYYKVFAYAPECVRIGYPQRIHSLRVFFEGV